MIADFMAALFRANLAGGAAVLLVLALRRPARRLFGARAAYRLWALAILASFAVLLPARTEHAPAAPQGTPILAAGPAFASPVAKPADLAAQPSLRASAVAMTPSPTAPGAAAGLFGVWLAGVAASVGLLAWRQWRFLKALGRLEVGDAGVAVAERSGVGPAVVGVFAPRVIVPADFDLRFTPEEQTVVLAHERAHLARQDARANGLLVFAQCLCWFNPLAHLAARLVRLDQELACDALVVRRHPAARRCYAEALLKTQIVATPLPLGCYWPSRARHPLEERIAMLKHPAPERAPPPCRSRRHARALPRRRRRGLGQPASPGRRRQDGALVGDAAAHLASRPADSACGARAGGSQRGGRSHRRLDRGDQVARPAYGLPHP